MTQRSKQIQHVFLAHFGLCTSVTLWLRLLKIAISEVDQKNQKIRPRARIEPIIAHCVIVPRTLPP